jgi:hypothetical protein
MSEIFDKLMCGCSKFDGNFESSLYLGLNRLILSRCWSNTFSFFGKFLVILFFVILKVAINTYNLYLKERDLYVLLFKKRITKIYNLLLKLFTL